MRLGSGLGDERRRDERGGGGIASSISDDAESVWMGMGWDGMDT